MVKVEMTKISAHHHFHFIVHPTGGVEATAGVSSANTREIEYASSIIGLLNSFAN